MMAVFHFVTMKSKDVGRRCIASAAVKSIGVLVTVIGWANGTDSLPKGDRNIR
jgi:hypothetical protein